VHRRASSCAHQSTGPAAFTAPHPGPTAVRSTGTRWRVLCTDLTKRDFLSNPQLRHRKPCICRIPVDASSVRNHVLLVFTHLYALPLPSRARANFRREHHLPHRPSSGDYTTEHYCNSMLAPQTQSLCRDFTGRHHRKPSRNRGQCYKCSLCHPATAIQWRIA